MVLRFLQTIPSLGGIYHTNTNSYQTIPITAPVSGYMFGKGIYLADSSSKSAGYCYSMNTGGEALLILCEAALGAMQTLREADYNAGTKAKKNDMHSTWGQGRIGPRRWVDAGIVHPSLKGVEMC
ncbi:hypothetical protein ACKRZS_006975 [Fusarium odoratissimum]